MKSKLEKANQFVKENAFLIGAGIATVGSAALVFIYSKETIKAYTEVVAKTAAMLEETKEELVKYGIEQIDWGKIEIFTKEK